MISPANTSHVLVKPFLVYGRPTILQVEIVKASAGSLTSLVVTGRCDSGGTFGPIASLAAHYTGAPYGRVMVASGDLTTIAFGTPGHLTLAVKGLDAVHIVASADVSLRFNWE